MNILITSVGRRSYLVDFFKFSLKDEGKVHLSNSKKCCPAKKSNDLFFQTPHILDETYPNVIFDYCKLNKIDIVIPLLDLDHFVLSKHKEKYHENEILILSSQENIVQGCFDKCSSLYLEIKNQINYPKTFNLNNDLTNLKEVLNEFSFPIILKPRYGFSSFDTLKIETFDEFKIVLPYLKYQISKRHKSYPLNSKLNLDNSILIQECIIGDEYNLDIINSLEGEFLTSISKLKFGMRSGETEICKIIYSDYLFELGRNISDQVGHCGPLDCDLIIDKLTGKVYLIDLNPRFGGGYPFSHAAGVDYPSFLLNEYKYGKKDFNFFEYKKNHTYAKQILVDAIE